LILYSLIFFTESIYSYEPFVSTEAYLFAKEHTGYVSFFECNSGFFLVNFDLIATNSNSTQVTLDSYGYIPLYDKYKSSQFSVCRNVFK
jgi:hypothetical protein